MMLLPKELKRHIVDFREGQAKALGHVFQGRTISWRDLNA